MRSVVLVLTIVVAIVATRGDGPTSATAATAGPRTIATSRGHVAAFAQSDHYAAWLSEGRCALRMKNLRTGARIRMDRGRDGGCGLLGVGQLVLAGDRAYWDVRSASLSTEYSELLTSSLRSPKARVIGFESHPQATDETLVPPAGDRRSAFYWTSPEDSAAGPLVRYDGLRRRNLTDTLEGIAGLAAGGGRVAFFSVLGRKYDCAGSPAWSPDGMRIAYASTTVNAPFAEAHCKGGLWIADVNGSGEKRIADDGWDPDWAPDGQRIAYSGNAGIFMASADGRHQQLVISGGYGPSWSPDGSQIAFWRFEDDGIHIAAADGTNERPFIAPAAEPDWSPDGTRLVFVARRHLYIANADGSGRRQLTHGQFGEDEPKWSPDGRTIAYSKDNGTINGIATIKPNGSGGSWGPGCATREQSCSSPSWAPDSRRLAWVQAVYAEDSDSHVWAQGASRRKRLSRRTVDGTSIVFASRTGRYTGRARVADEALAVAVTRDLTAVLTVGRPAQIRIYGRWRRTLKVGGAPAPTLSASGPTIVFRVGRTIYALDARRGSPRVAAHAATTPIGLSIVGRRIAWAENLRRGARVRALTLP